MLRFLPAFCAAWLAVCAAHAQGTAPSGVPEPVFPPVDRPWTLADVNRAAVVLHKTAQEQPADLPHYSIGSRSLFGRLTAPGVLVDGSARTAEQRLAYHSRVVRLYEQILLIYARTQTRQGGHDVEIAELGSLLLRATNRMAQDLEEIVSEVPEADRAAFSEGETRIRSGLVQMMTGVLEMIGDPDALALNARSRLLVYAVRTGAPIARVLTAEQRADVAAQIDALLQRNDLDELEEGDLRALRASFQP